MIKLILQKIRIGDKLEYIFRKTGIKFIAKKIDPNCNCDLRQAWLNGESKLIIKRKIR